MNLPRHKLFRVFPLVIAAFLILNGFAKADEVELLESGLIDLDRAIGTAPFGVTETGPDSSENTGEGTDADPEIPPDTEESGDPEADETDEFAADYDSEAFITVRVRGETVYLGREVCPVGRLREELRSLYDGTKSVKLFDDYADAGTYERVLEILDDLGRSIGLTYESQ